MRRFRFHNVTPPGGAYFYKIPENGEECLAGDLSQLVGRVREVYVKNSIVPPENLAELIEHYICLNVPESFCVGAFEPGDAQSRQVSAKDVKEATAFRTIRLKWGTKDFLVTPEEAERRAAICVRCSLNYEKFCTACNGLKNYVVDAIGTRTTTLDARLGVCSVCSCLLKAKVHISAAALKAARRLSTEGTYPPNCWMKGIME